MTRPSPPNRVLGDENRAEPVQGRAAFVELLDAQLREPTRGPLAVMVLRPNDQHFLECCGCYDGDQVLGALTEAITSQLRGSERFARLRESTFAVLAPADRAAGIRLVSEIMFVIESPSHHQLPLSVSAGIVLVPSPGPDEAVATGTDLVERASVALDTVQTVAWGVAEYTPDMMTEHANGRRLRAAVTHSAQTEPTADIDVLFEPVVELVSGRTVGLAARAAWYDDDHTVISAGRLITMARYAGLASRVDELVMQTAVTRFAEWADGRPNSGARLWLTLCTDTLSDGKFPPMLRQLLHDVDLAPECLVVDPFDDLYQGPHVQAARRSLARLRGYGVKVSAANVMAMLENPPDCGEGVGSADYLSISPTAVERCVTDPRARELVAAAVRFAADHQVGSAARQVTTAEQHATLREFGCRLARGPFYGQPQLASQAADLMADLTAGVIDGDQDVTS